MGWQISLVKNTININEQIAAELFEKANDGQWYDLKDVMYDEKLYFDGDHMEHMDYMWNEKVQKILTQHKVKGIVSFTSTEGDNRGESWGYEFDGKGKMFHLTGKITWVRR